MLWLFGQIWLWLLISFALGAAVTGLLFTRLGFHRTEPASPPAVVDAITHVATPASEDPEEMVPEPTYPPRALDESLPALPETGYREGLLPADHWPPDGRAEENGSTGEPVWPQEEDLPSAERQPGDRR